MSSIQFSITIIDEAVDEIKTYILDRLPNWKIEVDDSSPDLFNNYSEEGIFYLTPENVGDVIGDEESFMYLINNDYNLTKSQNRQFLQIIFNLFAFHGKMNIKVKKYNLMEKLLRSKQ